MEVRLVVDNANTKQRTWRLHHGETIVGRRRDCHLRILSAEVSRRHCLLSIDKGYVTVEDLDSVNGTFINGTRVIGTQILRPGDHLEIGPLEFIVEYELTESALNRLEQQAAEDATREEIEVLPLASADLEANPRGSAKDGEEPAARRDEVQSPPQELKETPFPSTPPADNEEPLPLLDDAVADWHLPQTDDLRELLSQVEEPVSGPRQGKR